MVVDVDEAVGADPRGRQQILPDRAVVGRGGRAERRGVPLGQQPRLAHQPSIVVARQGRIGRRPLQHREQVDRGVVEASSSARRRRPPGEQIIAQIFEQDEPGGAVRGDHRRRAQAELAQPAPIARNGPRSSAAGGTSISTAGARRRRGARSGAPRHRPRAACAWRRPSRSAEEVIDRGAALAHRSASSIASRSAQPGPAHQARDPGLRPGPLREADVEPVLRQQRRGALGPFDQPGLVRGRRDQAELDRARPDPRCGRDRCGGSVARPARSPGSA